MNIYEAVSGIMAEGYAIGKNKKNAQQGFMYRGIDDVMNTFQPLLSKYKVFVVPEVLEQTREERVTGRGTNLLYSVLKMKYTFYAEDGTSVSAIVIGEGMDSGDKASNKAMAIAMKYALFQTFCIPTEEMKDPDADTPEHSFKKSAAPKQEAPKQEAPKKDNGSWGEIAKPIFKCADCGAAITEVTTKNGKHYAVDELVKMSSNYYGRNLCYACACKAAKENGK